MSKFNVKMEVSKTERKSSKNIPKHFNFYETYKMKYGIVPNNSLEVVTIYLYNLGDGVHVNFTLYLPNTQ